MRRAYKYLPGMAVLCISACGGSGGEPGEAPVFEAPPVLSVPGTIRVPDEQGFRVLSEGEHESILLYCWIPMGEYPEGEADLYFLEDLEERGITPVPVQFSPSVRNASQNQLNRLGIPLAVALGDDSLKGFMNIEFLPAAVLVRSNGETMTGTGFGCAERVVRSLR